MSDTSQRLSQARWNCKSHVVFVPKRRRKALLGTLRTALGPILQALARQQDGRIIEGPVRSEPGHRGLERPPMQAVASGLGCLTGKSALASARQVSGRERHCTGEHFWARGYAGSTVGVELEPVRA